jgi:DNA topoisomerase I
MSANPGDVRTRVPADEAVRAALRYSNADEPGIRRLPHGRGFRYVDADDRRVTARDTIARIRALAIPPAWRDVRICADANGHIQATGRDARGRKQYRYHARWTAHRSETKYAKLSVWVEQLANLRRTVAADLRRYAALDRARVVATVVALLDESSMRIGNPEYARTNRSFGLTTLRDRHATVSTRRVRFRFRGKSGIEHDVSIDNPRLARIVKRCQDLPGQHLFQYLDDGGTRRAVTSQDVNAYIRAATSDAFSAKDLRTWRGTVLAAEALSAMPRPASAAECRRHARAAAKHAAATLGNTVAIAQRCYIHPLVVESHENGSLQRVFAATLPTRRWLQRGEVAVLRLLERRRRGTAHAKPAKSAPRARRHATRPRKRDTARRAA